MKRKLFLLLLLMIFFNNINLQKKIVSKYDFSHNDKKSDECNIKENDALILNEIATYISSKKVFKVNNFDSKYLDKIKYPYQLKLIEDDLKEQIKQFIIKKPFVRFKDSICDKYFFIDYNKINFQFLWIAYKEGNKFINAFISYKVKEQLIPFTVNLLEYKYQYTNLDILNAVFHKYLLIFNAKIQFYDPSLESNFWNDQINENLKLFLENEIFKINNEIFRNINYYDFFINSVRKKDFLEEKITIDIDYKDSNKLFIFDVEYFWNKAKEINFIKERLKDKEIKISYTFNDWTDKENSLILNELFDIIGQGTIDEFGFNIRFNLEKINIINLNDGNQINNRREIELDILYDENVIHKNKSIFVNEPDPEKANKLSDVKLLVEDNIELDITKLDFSYAKDDLSNCLNIIINQLDSKVHKLIIPHKERNLINYLSENIKIDTYWLNLYGNKEIYLILEDEDFKNILKIKLKIFENNKNDSKKIWSNIFQQNFNLLDNENKKYFIRTSYLKKYYYENFRNSYDYIRILPYIEKIWKTVLNYKDKAVLYNDNKVIKSNQFRLVDYKIINLTRDSWQHDEQINKILKHIDFNIKDIDGNESKNNFNAILINAKISSLDIEENYAFILPIFIDSDIFLIK